MYKEFMDTLVKYMTALDEVNKTIDESDGLRPYLGKIEVKLDTEVVGYLTDQDGIGFIYEAAES